MSTDVVKVRVAPEVQVVNVRVPTEVQVLKVHVAPEPSIVKVQLPGIAGPPGPQGPGGGTAGAEVFVQETPLATWTFTHSLGRLPTVTIYIGGEIVWAPVDANATTVSVTFPSPQTGSLVLS